MSFSSMMWIPGYAIYYMATSTGSLHDVRSKKEEKKKSPCGGEMPHLLMSKPNMATKKLQSNKGAGKAAQHSYYNYCFNLTNWPIYSLYTLQFNKHCLLSTFFYSSFLPSPEHLKRLPFKHVKIYLAVSDSSFIVQNVLVHFNIKQVNYICYCFVSTKTNLIIFKI